MKAFITATGTDIGKTHIACGLIRHWRAAGHDVVALKPILSGCDPSQPHATDAGLLLTALGRAPTDGAVAAIAPWRFAAPLSPDWAAMRERRAIDPLAVLDFCRDRTTGAAHAVVEGAGGVCVPIAYPFTMLDLMAGLAFPVLLVAGTYLGTVSHTLTALEALNRRNLRAVVCLNESPPAPGTPPFDETLARFAAYGAAPTIGLRRAPPDRQAAAFAALDAELTRVRASCP
jgi:dethiobiotin synthetase